MDPTDKCGTAVLGFGEMVKMFGDEDGEGIVMEWRVIGMLPDNGNAGRCRQLLRVPRGAGDSGL